MGFEARKTEHCGAKRGNGAYWGYKWEAKKESNRIRRENWKREIRDELSRDGADNGQSLQSVTGFPVLERPCPLASSSPTLASSPDL